MIDTGIAKLNSMAQQFQLAATGSSNTPIEQLFQKAKEDPAAVIGNHQLLTQVKLTQILTDFDQAGKALLKSHEKRLSHLFKKIFSPEKVEARV
jgi:hypothetical protein